MLGLKGRRGGDYHAGKLNIGRISFTLYKLVDKNKTNLHNDLLFPFKGEIYLIVKWII